MNRKHDHPKRRPVPCEPGISACVPVEALSSTHRTVRFEFLAPNAQDVFIAGSFDEWNPTGLPMVRLENGTWSKELVLCPGTYEYLFIVDGVWTPDPLATACVPNPYGGVNSCFTVT